MARIDSFLRLVVEQGASDLHFAAGHVPTIRHDGELLRLPFRALSEREARRFLEEILSPEQRRQLAENVEIDLVYDLEDAARFRISIFTQAAGVSAAFRVIPREVPTLAKLRLPASIKRLTRLANGLVLVTGPTGSGKTTSLTAMINEINTHDQRHIITVEDPIEFVHRPKKSVITQRQVGRHTNSFASALRSALRQSPDVLVIGEMRDLETISLALAAAETGVLVFGTLHTRSAAGAVSRIIDAVPEGYRDQTLGVLSVLLRGVIAQQLCRRANGDGRVAIIEILLQNYAISNMIRQNKIHQVDAYLQSANYRETGMLGIDQSIIRCVRSRSITAEDGLKLARQPGKVERAIAAALGE